MNAAYAIVFIFGLFAGSFANVLIYRIPLKKSIIAPRSACTNCGTKLAMPDLVPVLSYILLGGKCRYCGAGISPEYLIVELLTAGVFTILFAFYGLSVPFFVFAYLMTILISIFFIDIRYKIIPNGLVAAGLAGGAVFFVINLFMPFEEIFGDDKWWTPLAGLFPGSVFLLLVALIGSFIYKTDDVMGMGDVKLMAAIGIFLGWRLCFAALFISVILGGLVSVFLILFRFKKRRDTVAFGPFIVAGTFATILFGRYILQNYF
jgi:leader peptidase (prepilin peptidase)/N-methyltransferase